MSHRRVKNIDYDDDEDGFSEAEDYVGAPADEELSVEDRLSLWSAVAHTRRALGPVAAAVVTDRELRDAAWEAYFDVDAASSELKSLPKVKQAISRAGSELDVSPDSLNGAPAAALEILPGAPWLDKDPFADPSPDDRIYHAQLGAARLALSEMKMGTAVQAGQKNGLSKQATALSTASSGTVKAQSTRSQEGTGSNRQNGTGTDTTTSTERGPAKLSGKEKAAATKAARAASSKPVTPAEPRSAMKAVAKGISRLDFGTKSGASTPGFQTPSKRKIDVVTAWKKSQQSEKQMSSFVVIGHVDHGKSTLMGQLLVSLSVVSNTALRSVHKTATLLNKVSFALAFLMDSNPDERERGVTVDVSTRHFETKSTIFTILDAPGHRDFVPNMIAGVAQADFAVLVVDARTDGFEAGIRGQTNEHAIIARSASGAGGTIIVAVNKMDAANWNQSRFNQIQEQMTSFLGKLGYAPERVVCVPCAGLTGENVVKAVSAQQTPSAEKGSAVADASWYSGPTLLQALDNAATMTAVSANVVERPLRFEAYDVHRASHSGGSGAFVSSSSIAVGGRILAGNIQVGDDLTLAGTDGRVIVRGIEVPGSGSTEASEWAVAGSNVTLHLTAAPSSSFNIDDIQQGDMFTTPVDALQITLQSSFRARILALDTLAPGPIDVFAGVRMLDGVVRTPIVGIVDTKTTAGPTTDREEVQYSRKAPKIVKAGSTAVMDISILGLGADAGSADRAGAGESDRGSDRAAKLSDRPGTAATASAVPTAAGVWAEKGRRVILRVEGRTVGMGVML